MSIKQPLKKHRNSKDLAQAVGWAQKVISKPKSYLVLVLATTGLEESDTIKKIVIMSMDQKIVLDSSVTLKKWDDLELDLMQLIGSKTCICYNAEFVSRMFQQTIDKTKQGSYLPKLECAMEAYSKFVGSRIRKTGKYHRQPLSDNDLAPIDRAKKIIEIITIMAIYKMPEPIKSEPIANCTPPPIVSAKISKAGLLLTVIPILLLILLMVIGLAYNNKAGVTHSTSKSAK